MVYLFLSAPSASAPTRPLHRAPAHFYLQRARRSTSFLFPPLHSRAPSRSKKNPAPSRHPIPPPSPIPAPVARRPLRAAARPSTPLPPPSRGDLRVWDRHIRNNADWDLCVARGVVQDRRRLRSPPLSSTTATHRAVRSTKP
jgi:hypothetical protein